MRSALETSAREKKVKGAIALLEAIEAAAGEGKADDGGSKSNKKAPVPAKKRR